jgi:hypothetical protein
MDTFIDIVKAALAAERPQRLLFLFVRAVDAEPDSDYHIAGARLQPVVSLDKILSSTLRFAAVVAEADFLEPGWDFVLISALSKRDGGLPSPQEAQDHLRKRAHDALQSGDLSGFLVFDRREQPLQLEAERALH